MKTKFNFLIFSFLFFMFLMSSCQYNTIVEPVIPPPNPTDTVSFSNKIEPIFVTEGCVSCHPGSHSPDLTTGNAYASISSSNLVNTSDPESSLIYWFPNPDNTADHTWKKYTAAEAQLVLQWIKQGANDN